MAGVKRRVHTDSDIRALHKELDEVSCPICMDYPHNAVLLMCSSHEKGCRSYICDTSYRHSNCLDRFKKLRDIARSTPTSLSSLPRNHDISSNASDRHMAFRNGVIDVNQNNRPNRNNTGNAMFNGSHELPREQSNRENNTQNDVINVETQREVIVEIADSESFRERAQAETDADNSSESKLNLKCPLCRGDVLGWEVVDEARKYLNLKRRSCSRESCSYSGNYQELRRHARRIHPTTRPSDIDPSRERAWRRLEHQRDYGDIVSAIRSAIPGAVVVGDYVIENGDRFPAERANSSGEVGGPWWTTFFLFQMIGSMDSGGESRSRSRAWTRHRRPGGVSERRMLWGENLLGLQDEDEEDDSDGGLQIFSDGGEDDSPVPRRRRRLMRSRSDEDQS